MKPTIGPVCVKLIDAVTYAVTTTVDITDEFKKGQWVTPPIFWLVADELTGTTTCDVDINVSLDNGTTYVEVLSFTQLSADGNELLNPTKYPWGEKIQAVITLGGTATWKITLYAAGQAAGSSGA